MTLITLICADKKKANRELRKWARIPFRGFYESVLPQICTDEADQNKFRSGFICVICGERFWPKTKGQEPIFYI